uniref:CD80-like immunoglobulin C2-set domain-containing protein n=1 Tax=Glossina brevipalpis TaxID=37001 RepID=A0A1A9WU00_9MUSC
MELNIVSCEVSADAPSFHTLISAGDLEVVVVPGKEPVITGIKSRYHVGDIIRGNCTSAHSRPAANITWTINGYEDLRDLETVISGIHFVVTPQHFIRGKLKIRCTAHIHDVYWKSTEKSIEEDRQVARANEVNLVNSFSDDYFDLEDDIDDDNGDVQDRSAHITHIKGDMSSLNANGSTAAHFGTCLRLWPHLTTLPFLWYALQEILQLLRQLFGQQQITTAKTDNGLNRKVNKHSKHNIHYQQQRQQVEQHLSRTTAKATAANSQATLSYLLKWLQRKQTHSQASNNKKEN